MGARPSETPVAAGSQAVLTAWRRLLQVVRRRERLAERQSGLTGAQLSALRHIDAFPGSTIGRLAQLTTTDASSASVVVARLLAKGCVRRARDPDDHRRWRLFPTDEGRRRLDSALDGADRHLMAAIDALAPEDRERFALQLHRLATAVEAGTG